MQLFKFMRRAHLDGTLARGTFRIGTLHEYRDIERLGDQIGDEGEGKRDVHLTAYEPFTIDLLSTDPRAVHMRTVLKGWDEFPDGSRIIIEMGKDSQMVRNEDTPDHYMYCVSTKFDAAQIRAFGYDACLRINDAKGFFTELSNCIADASYVVGAPVQYRDRRVDYSEVGAASAAFLKPATYASQCEFRAIWEPLTRPITPLIVTCPKALLYSEEMVFS